MNNNLFVAGIAWTTTDEGLKAFFEQCGTVLSAKVIRDRETNRSKGFGFVEMSTEEEANAAIDILNGKELDGREITVNIARPKENRDSRD